MAKKSKTDNRSVGGGFEQKFADVLAAHGFWAHVLQQNKSGQPADIIAAKGKYHTLIDCKVISTKKGFPLSRVEMNQRSAMTLFQRRAAELCWFAFRLPDMSVWMMSIGRVIIREQEGMTHLSEQVIREHALSLEAWLKETEVWSKDI